MITTEVRESKKIGRERFWVVDAWTSPERLHKCVQPDGTTCVSYCDYETRANAQSALNRYLHRQQESFSDLDIDPTDGKAIRQFDTGATRDTDVDKPSYIKALSPIVLQCYVNYLGRHRLQSDGNLRNWDNWKNGIPQDVYLDGLGRHEMAVWLLCQDFPASDNHGPVTLIDSLCGVIFNAQGMLHELLKGEKEFVCPAGWVIALHDVDSCGWYVVVAKGSMKHLHKDLTIKPGTGYIGGDYKFGEASGYWPTKEAAEDALRQYLEQEKQT